VQDFIQIHLEIGLKLLWATWHFQQLLDDKIRLALTGVEAQGVEEKLFEPPNGEYVADHALRLPALDVFIKLLKEIKTHLVAFLLVCSKTEVGVDGTQVVKDVHL
jgi:hypothetical protein